jgi:hypothetical protein
MLVGVWLVVAAIAGLAFGAGDQALGSLTPLSWTWNHQVAEISATWLVLAFVVGMFQKTTLRAVIASAISALTAVAAYCAMILSPMEGVHLSRPVVQIVDTVHSQLPWFLGALVIGPIYGILGRRWRAERSLLSGIVLVGTICLEPVVRAVAGRTLPDADIGTVEVVCGVLLACALGVDFVRARSRTVPSN